jgi:hypothetical protein
MDRRQNRVLGVVPRRPSALARLFGRFPAVGGGQPENLAFLRRFFDLSASVG